MAAGSVRAYQFKPGPDSDHSGTKDQEGPGPVCQLVKWATSIATLAAVDAHTSRSLKLINI